MSKRITALANRLRADPFFLASALDGYARSERLTDDQLAAALGCTPATLPSLFLCRRPRPEPPHFREDVDAIASRFAVRADTLATAVRRADVLAAMGRAADAPDAIAGTLLAARDRLETEPPRDPPPDPDPDAR